MPTRASIAFNEIESLLGARGAEKTEREDSRVKPTLRGIEWHAHRPHPGKEAKKYQVEQTREFLTKLGMFAASASDTPCLAKLTASLTGSNMIFIDYYRMHNNRGQQLSKALNPVLFTTPINALPAR